MPIPTENDDSDAIATSADVPHCFKDDAAFVEVAGPCISGVEAPITRKRDGRDNKFPLDAGRFTAVEEGKEGVELFGAKHGFVRG